MRAWTRVAIIVAALVAAALVAPATPAAAGIGSEPRLIEESDIVRLEAHRLYILNPFRGLQVVDVADVDHPQMLGGAPVLGHPMEMYVRDAVAFVTASEVGTSEEGTPFGNIQAIDVRDPSRPVVLGAFRVDGFVTDSRIVGDVLYAVANRYAWYDYFGNTDRESTTVLSVNLAEPRAPHEVERIRFLGLATRIHATQDLLYVAQPNRDDANPETRITFVDIHDPVGAIHAVGEVTVRGIVTNKFQLFQAEGALRVVSHEGGLGTSGTQRLTVVDPADPTQPRVVSELSLPRTGGLWATRMDGDRVYLVTLVRVDAPVLHAIDASDPWEPVLMSSLELPGLLRLVLPRGDRLLALGTDHGTRADLTLSTFDVTGPPVPLDRVPVGPDGAYSPALWDDRAFALSEGLGLALIPYAFPSGRDPCQGPSCPHGRASGLALVDVNLASGDLTPRGRADQAGTVQRAIPTPGLPNRVLSLSERTLQTIDIANRDHPVVTAVLSLARDVSDFPHP